MNQQAKVHDELAEEIDQLYEETPNLEPSGPAALPAGDDSEPPGNDAVADEKNAEVASDSSPNQPPTPDQNRHHRHKNRQPGKEATEKHPPPAPDLNTPHENDGEVEQVLAQAHDLIQDGQRLKGYHQLRKLGQRYAGDPRVLKAWSEAAVAMRSWGEAYRVVKEWVKADGSAEARLELARVERALGNREEAIKILTELLKEDPKSQAAQRLMDVLNPSVGELAQN